MTTIRNRLRLFQKNSLLLLMMLLTGCMSLPAPTKLSDADIKQTLREVRIQINRNQPEVAISLLKQAKNKFTDGEKLENGQGIFFQAEALTLATIGHLEFNRNRLADAVSYWKDSFNVEMNGLQAQNEIQKKNAFAIDIIGAVLIGAATGAVSRSSKSSSKTSTTTYFYTVPNTSWPVPEMLRVGAPTNTVLRFPVRVELAPFSNIVKLRSGGNSCTATMVAPRVAISAAHCMSEGGGAQASTQMSIQRKSILPSKEVRVARHFTHQGENAAWDGKRENDWIILVLEGGDDTQGPVWGARYSTVARPNSEISEGNQKLMLAGYSSDLSQGAYLTLHYGCQMKPGQNLKTGVFLTNCEDATGSSGSALMSTLPPYDIVGIHTAKVVKPKDDFSSVEIFSDQFIATLNGVLGKKLPVNSPVVAVQAVAKRDSDNTATAPPVANRSPLPLTVENKPQGTGVEKSEAPVSGDVEEKLKLLIKLRNQQLITEQDYQQKRGAILKGL